MIVAHSLRETLNRVLLFFTYSLCYLAHTSPLFAFRVLESNYSIAILLVVTY